jgi:hypothetical protein
MQQKKSIVVTGKKEEKNKADNINLEKKEEKIDLIKMQQSSFLFKNVTPWRPVWSR